MLPIQTIFPEHFFSEEVQQNYLITAQTKKHWAVLLDLLLEFDRVCKKHSIQYTLDAGTLLGAVRHKGFVPWDDDVDLIMFRSEYDKLCKVAPQEFKHPYFWQTNETDPGSLRRHAQLRNSETTCILTNEMENGQPLYTFNQGIFIDIFILDAIPDCAEQLNAFRQTLSMHVSVLWELRQIYFSNGCLSWIQDALIQEAQLFDEIVAQYNGSGCKRIANISLDPQRKDSVLFEAELYMDIVDYEFEGFSFPGPRQSDVILEGYYGNWKEFVIGNNTHGGTLTDTEKPYTYYLRNSLQAKKETNKHHALTDILLQRNTAWMEIEQLHHSLSRMREAHEQTQSSLLLAREENEELHRSLLSTMAERQELIETLNLMRAGFWNRLKNKIFE